MSGKSRIEKILENLLGGDNVIEPPIGRDEKILYSILNDLEYTEPPHSIFEELLLAIKNSSPLETEYAYDYLTRDEKILFCKLNRLEYFEPPHSRLEKLLIRWLYLDLYLNIDGVPPFTFISNGSPIIDYLISGNTVQSGTPTPDSPIMPEGCGDITANMLSVYKENYSINANGVETFNNVAMIYKANVNVSGSTFTLDFGGLAAGDVVRIHAYTGDIWKAQIAAISITQVPFAFTVSSEVDNIRISIRKTATDVTLTDEQYKIPISSANTTTPVYLGEVETTRKIRKLVLTGTENWSITSNYRLRIGIAGPLRTSAPLCTHYIGSGANAWANIPDKSITASIAGYLAIYDSDYDNVNDFKRFLSEQYAAGTPVCVWYVLATEETAIVNEPLMKIGDYADSINYEQTVVSIPTVSGRNTFDVLGDVKPSNVEITYAPRAPLLRTRKTILKK